MAIPDGVAPNSLASSSASSLFGASIKNMSLAFAVCFLDIFLVLAVAISFCTSKKERNLTSEVEIVTTTRRVSGTDNKKDMVDGIKAEQVPSESPRDQDNKLSRQNSDAEFADACENVRE